MLCLIRKEIILMRREEEGRREPVDAVTAEEEAGVQRPYCQEVTLKNRNLEWEVLK